MAGDEHDAEASDVEVLRSACDESRAVLDDQLAELADIGDKALWTVRTSMIVLGVVVSAASLADTDALSAVHWSVRGAAGFGVLALLAASLYGLGLYVVMDRIRGVGTEYRRRAADGGLNEQAWRLVLLEGYDDWVATMEQRTDVYGARLFVVQMVFYCGVFSFALAGCLSIVTP